MNLALKVPRRCARAGRRASNERGQRPPPAQRLRAATGPLQFARWLVKHTDAKDRHEIVPVHALESYLMQVLRPAHLAEVERTAQADAVAELVRAELRAVAVPPRIVRGKVVEDRLAAELEAEHADGFVIGRQVLSGEHHLVPPKWPA